MKNMTRATKNDGAKVINLLLKALEDVAFSLTGTTNKKEVLNTLVYYFKNNTRLSYKNIYIYKKDENIVGAVCLYSGSEAKKLDEFIIKHIKQKGVHITCFDKECFEDEFYIDSIAVEKEFRNQGIAKKLFNYAETLAKKQGYKKLSLVVEENKTKTKTYYERLGFKDNCKLTISNHEYFHMIKVL